MNGYAVATITEHFASLSDLRVDRTKEHLLTVSSTNSCE